MSIYTKLKQLNIYRIPKENTHKGRAKTRKRIKAAKLKKFADRLNESLPKSEVWFQKLYKEFNHVDDRYNEPLGRYIPDVSNDRYKYVIEIDGDIHLDAAVKRKDYIKTKFYLTKGYRVYRIKAYNTKDFESALTEVLNLRESVSKPKVILRRHPVSSERKNN